MSQWETTAARGMALANSSAAGHIASVVGDRRDLSPTAQDWLRLRLMRTTTRTLASPRLRPSTGVVNRTASAVRAVGEQRLRSLAADAARQRVEDVVERRLGTRFLPSGYPAALPVLPWYATVNLWWVTVEGEYARFAVTASRGPPGAPGATTRYVREESAVTRDVDGDGDAERLGRNSPISFRADTGVVVVVPPRPRGVGDKGGNSVETSAGWPDAG